MNNNLAADIQTLAARIAADATNAQLDDAAFRRRAKRTAATALKIMDASDRRHVTRREGTPAASRYVFVAVPNGSGGTTSVSIARATFEELAARLGGARAVTALARDVGASHKPDTGVSRSAYVLKRLQQRAAKVKQTPSQAPSTQRGSAVSKLHSA